jgi:hypothetical protein
MLLIKRNGFPFLIKIIKFPVFVNGAYRHTLFA